jgi:hypothetical protein
MKYNVRWTSEEHHTVLMEFVEDWQWSDFGQATREAHALMDSVTHPVDLIVWHRVRLPPGSPLSAFRSAARAEPPNLRLTAVVVPNFEAFYQALSDIMATFFPDKNKVIIVNSFEDAVAALEARRVVQG